MPQKPNPAPKPTIIRPHPGPQELFLSTPADIAIYGGGAGGGKTFALLMEPLRNYRVPGFHATFFRRETPNITNPGGLWDESQNLYRAVGGKPRESPRHEWTFPGYDARFLFTHLQHLKTVYGYQGAQIPLQLWDELTHFMEEQFLYMLSRSRSTCGVKPYIRATCNPDPDSWVADWVSWYIHQETGLALPEKSGVIRYFLRIGDKMLWGNSREQLFEEAKPERIEDIKSFTFIAAKLDDNPTLLEKDPGYRSNLLALNEVERRRLLNGDWKVRQQGKIFKDPNLGPWPETMECRGWVDTAFAGKDSSSFSLIGSWQGKIYLRGWAWREHISNLYKRIFGLAKDNRCGSIYWEENKDEGASAKEFRRDYWPATINKRESMNKHAKIMLYLEKHWRSITVASDCQKEYLGQILSYEEGKGPDDAPDGAASLIRELGPDLGLQRDTLMDRFK